MEETYFVIGFNQCHIMDGTELRKRIEKDYYGVGNLMVHMPKTHTPLHWNDKCIIVKSGVGVPDLLKRSLNVKQL